MQLFSSNRKIREVQGLLLWLANNHCSELQAFRDGPRLAGRAPLMVVALVTPLRDGQPCVANTFAAVTKEISTSGMSLVLSEPRSLDEVLIGLRCDAGKLKFIRAKARHVAPMGAGFFQVGLRCHEVVPNHAFPELASLMI